MPTNHNHNIKTIFRHMYMIFALLVTIFSISLHLFSFTPLFAEDNPSEESAILEEVIAMDMDIQTPCTSEDTQECGDDAVACDIPDGCSEGVVLCDDEDEDCTAQEDVYPDEEIADSAVETGQIGTIIADSNTHGSSNTTHTTPEDVTDTIDSNFFAYSFVKNNYDAKTMVLQDMLRQLGVFTGITDGIYDDKTLAAVYQYQIIHEILTPQSAAHMRGVLDDVTRTLLNQDYRKYRENALYPIILSHTSYGTIMDTMMGDLQKRAAQIRKQSDYFLDKAYRQRYHKTKSYMVGDTDIDLAVLEGKFSIPIMIESSNTLHDAKASVLFEEDTVLTTEDGNIFTGTLTKPTLLDTTVADILSGQDIVSVVDVGGHDGSIIVQDTNGQAKNSIIKMPAPGLDVGSTVVVNYSQDGQLWDFLDTSTVFVEDGTTFVEFTTTHFTFFAVGVPLGYFVINDDDLSTTSTGVTLSMDVYGATQMRFANTSTGLTSASWVAYDTSYSRFLENISADQKVYAQFDGPRGIQEIYDTIFFEKSGTNLLFHIGGSISGNLILDSTSNANHFTMVGDILNPIVDGYRSLMIVGGEQYGELGDIGITAYPFTLVAWARANSLDPSVILSIGNSASNTVYWGIQFNSGIPSMVARNTTLRTLNAGTAAATGERKHIVGVFNASNSRELYVDGVLAGTQTTLADFSATNQQVRIGKMAGTIRTVFNGYVDDLRIYDKALSPQEIADLYAYRESVSIPASPINVSSFSINTGMITTYNTGVFLSIDVQGASHMKFANSTGGLDTADWVTYAPGYDRALPNSTGNHIVYAAFSGSRGIAYAQDNIFYDDPNIDSDLILLVDGSMDGTTVLDKTNYNNHLTAFGEISNPILGIEELLAFNGVNYAERGSVAITGFPFSFAAWVRPNSVAGIDVILSIGNSASTNVYRSIELLNGFPSMSARNTTLRRTSGGGAGVAGQRRHIVGVFHAANDRRLYVDGVPVATNGTVVNFSDTNQTIRIAKYAAIQPTPLDGYLDDLRIYKKSLTNQEVADLYQTRVDREQFPTAEVIYDITSPTEDPVTVTLTGASESITIVNNSGSDSYTFTENGSFTFFFQNSVGNIGSAIASVDWITTIPSGIVGIVGPDVLSFGETTVSSDIQEWESAFTGSNQYFIVEDSLGSNDGYYTTIDISSLQYDSYNIANTSISVKTLGSIQTLTGTTNSNVVSALSGSYTEAAGPLTFIKRDPGSNGGVTGNYGAHIGIKIDIPPLQSPGTYTGTIVYTIY